MARKRKSGVTARQDSEARDVKDDRDWTSRSRYERMRRSATKAPVPLASTR